MTVQSPPGSAKADDAITRSTYLKSIANWMKAIPDHNLIGGMVLSWGSAAEVVDEAVDEITRLRADLKEALEALKECADALHNPNTVERARTIFAKHKDSNHDK